MNDFVAAAVLAVLALLWWAGYLLACRIWPYTACPRCRARGVRPSPSHRAWRTCPHCEGTGQRPRLGTRLREHRAHRRAHH